MSSEARLSGMASSVHGLHMQGHLQDHDPIGARAPAFVSIFQATPTLSEVFKVLHASTQHLNAWNLIP